MKLYYMPGACSLAVNISLREAGLPFSLVRLDKKTQLLDDGRSIANVNPKGYVPVLEFDDGARLTEVTAVLQWVADQVPHTKLAPPAGTMARYHLIEWLNYTATELHKAYWPLFHDGAPIENENARAKLAKGFAWVETQLGQGPYLFGESFTVADAYLFTVVNWAKAGGIDLAPWPKLKDYRGRIRERASVVEALKSEGLLRP